MTTISTAVLKRIFKVKSCNAPGDDDLILPDTNISGPIKINSEIHRVCWDISESTNVMHLGRLGELGFKFDIDQYVLRVHVNLSTTL